MPFTPMHMGPGILIKALLQGSFSLMVFGWTQIIMDIQPLIVLISGEGHLHGFSHTYVGAILLGAFSALTGKYLSQIALSLLGISQDTLLPATTPAIPKPTNPIVIKWWVCLLSAMLGSFSHVFLDSIMHIDVEPFFPITLANDFHGLISVKLIHKICLYSGLVGAGIYFVVSFYHSRSVELRK